MALPLTKRPLDLTYVSFFLIHIIGSLLCDFQALYPQQLIPGAFKSLISKYLDHSGDPLIAGALGMNGPMENWDWFMSFLTMEAIFQFPIFFIGAYYLWRDSRWVYPILLAYSSSSLTTIITCLYVVLQVPINETPVDLSQGPIMSITPSQRMAVLQAYGSFGAVVALMTVDMGIRVSALVRKGMEAEYAVGKKTN